MAKDSPRSTAGELQKTVESRGQKTLKKKCQTAPTSPHVVWEGFKKKISSLIQKQSPTYSVVRHDRNFKRDWLLWSDEIIYIYIFSSKHSRWVW